MGFSLFLDILHRAIITQNGKSEETHMVVNFYVTLCVRSSQDYTQVQKLARLTELREVVMLIVKVYYSKRIRTKISKGERAEFRADGNHCPSV